MTLHTTETSQPEAVEIKDPVCGMAVPADNHYRHVHGEQTYLFCSASCLAKFQVSPTAYIGAGKAQSSAVPGDVNYSCPMHPEVSSNHPGSCPKCGMALEQVTTASGATTNAKPILSCLVACVSLLAVYFGVVGLISGMNFALEQFATYWYFIVPLALGFGLQVGLFIYLKQLAGQHGASGKVVAVSGTTSTAAMVSCCAHYLSNILPILGVTGFLTVVAEYQVELFWLGLAFNVAGVLYILSKVVNAYREHKKC